MVELIIVMMLVGILAVFAFPKMQAAISIQDDAWRDQLVAAVRHAQKTAVSHRRLVCLTVTTTAGANSVSLRIASANPTVAVGGCDSDLAGPDGTATFASSKSASTTVSPAGVIYCQPDGRVTSDVAGDTAVSRTITIAGAGNVVIHGDTGFVE